MHNGHTIFKKKNKLKIILFASVLTLDSEYKNSTADTLLETLRTNCDGHLSLCSRGVIEIIAMIHNTSDEYDKCVINPLALRSDESGQGKEEVNPMENQSFLFLRR